MEATPGVLHEPQVQLDQVLRDQAEGDVGPEERCGFCAQRFRMTSELRSSAGMPELSPAGAIVSAKSMIRAIFLSSAMPQPQVIVQKVQHAVRDCAAGRPKSWSRESCRTRRARSKSAFMSGWRS